MELAIVMPAYNEEACIATVIGSWLRVLSGLHIDFRVIVLNDGSQDRTIDALCAFEGDSRVEIVDKPNSGHGPTILDGYRRAVNMAEWVFQCDSDDEMKAEHFPELWNRRADHDALFGCRHGRSQNVARKLVSAASRCVVRAVFGNGVLDVNTPYRLIRSNLLRQIVRQIPSDTFAPNLIISGALAKAGVRICNVPIPHENRRTGTVSIVKWKLWQSALKASWQTLRCRPAIDPTERSETGGTKHDGD